MPTSILNAILTFVATHSSPDIQRFRDNHTKWGDQFIETPAHYLPAAEHLRNDTLPTTPTARQLMNAFEQNFDSLRWEQTYTKQESLVGNDMLAGYGFAEIIGKRGPCVSERVRSGIGIWGPHIQYPVHWHQPEEVYVVLAGSAEFQLDNAPYQRKIPGDTIFVPSNLKHAFRTTGEPLVVFYIWQNGDMRELSQFK